MAIIRRVFGPFGAERVGGALPELRWYFFGIRGDRTTAHWVLVFEVNARKFRARSIPINDSLTSRTRLALMRIGVEPTVKNEDAHPDAWLNNEPVMDGAITEILKSRLSSAEVAKATALAIVKR